MSWTERERERERERGKGRKYAFLCFLCHSRVTKFSREKERETEGEK